MVSSADGNAAATAQSGSSTGRAALGDASVTFTVRIDDNPSNRRGCMNPFRPLRILPLLTLAVAVALTASNGAAQNRTCLGRTVTIFNDTVGASVYGTGGADVILVTGDGQTISAFGGDDVVCSEGIYSTILGGSGNDTIWANGATHVDGQSGHDALTAFGVVGLTGGTGNDQLEGASVHIARGGAGNDLFRLRSTDHCDGGSGHDRVLTVDGPGCGEIVNVP
jgi:Ca2+-binding RTX toxin-like protein